MTVATSAVLVAGPWVLTSLALVLTYKVVVVILVRSSKTDFVYRDRWTGTWVRRGRRDSEAPDVANTKTQPKRPSVERSDPTADPSKRSG